MAQDSRLDLHLGLPHLVHPLVEVIALEVTPIYPLVHPGETASLEAYQDIGQTLEFISPRILDAVVHVEAAVPQSASKTLVRGS